ncbi:MAG: preprotein translocase subunit SecY [Patescibacteria group bacterium]
MDTFLTKIKLLLADKVIVRRILITIGLLILFRFGDAVPIPGVDQARLTSYLAGNSFLGLLSLFSGGGISRLSLFMLGVGPYITATIIMQLLTMVFPKMKEMYQEEGDLGRKKFSQYSRILTVPLALIQGFGFLALLRTQNILGTSTLSDQLINLLVITAGAVLAMWIGELITEYGISNGTSLIIFAGIVSRIPAIASQVSATYDPSQLPLYLLFLGLAVLVVAAVIFITEAERPVPVTYAKQVRGMKVYGGASTYLPLRVNQSGVIPIIFALSILLFPQIISQFLVGINHSVAQAIGGFLRDFLQNSWLYAGGYFILVFAFTYFYTAVTFDPDKISENLQKSGAFIPGIRPGRPTSEYLAKVLTRLTLVGATFLSIIAVLPLVLQSLTGNATLAIGGTGLLIVVSVILELVKQLDAQVSMKEY